jgi:hypothetical protein
MGSGGHRDENMSDDLKIFSSPELYDNLKMTRNNNQQRIILILA